MNVYIDAWLERRDPVVYIRSCENGQALFCLKGEEIDDLMNTQDFCRKDLLNDFPTQIQLMNVIS